MILAALYFLVFCVILWRSRFFADEQVSRRVLLLVFAAKCLGCFAYYWMYYVYYPDTFMCDTKATMQDARMIYSALPQHPGDYIKMLTGFHSELETDSLYKHYFQHMDKWHRREESEFFLNDNRTMTRINAFFMLFSFGRYPVHALFMAMLSFAGQWLLFKTFRRWFAGKESWLLLIVFFTPSLFFWTSGVLKEPVTLALMGLLLYTWFRLFIERVYRLKYMLMLLLSLACFIVMKPYVMVLLLFPLLIFTLAHRRAYQKPALAYLLAAALLTGSTGLVLKYVFGKDIVATIVKRQNDFVSLSYGGRFFLTPEKYVRFDYADTAMLQLVDAKRQLYRFRPHARYMYWNMPNLNDTIRVSDNVDTTLYPCIARIAPAGSGIYFKRLNYSFSSILRMIPDAYINVLFKPLFYQSSSPTELFASLENVLLLLFILCSLLFRSPEPRPRNLFCFLLCTVLLAFLLIGLTTTVSGAIVRYKALFLPFLLMMPLLLIDEGSLRKIPFVNRLVNKQ